MHKILILVEGPTEENFTTRLLLPYLSGFNVFPTPILATTRKVKGEPAPFKGGITDYAKVRRDLMGLLRDRSASLVTTMIDYYGLPDDFPGQQHRPAGSCYQIIEHLEEAFRQDINHRKFLPYFSLHEFEALLFTSPEIIATNFPETDLRSELSKIRNAFGSPEEINDDPRTAPSKRLKTLYPQYRKVAQGLAIAEQVGLSLMRNECRHFNDWLTKLETLGQASV